MVKGIQADEKVKAGGRARDGNVVPLSTVQSRIDGLVCMADVEPQAVHWLWRGRIPLGKITVIDGDPDKGKSTMTIDLAARVTTGRDMPDGPGLDAPAAVLFLTAEDGLNDTLAPRLIAAAADRALVHTWQEVKDGDSTRAPMLPADVLHLEAFIRKTGARLVIIDPLMAFLGGAPGQQIDSFKDNDVRRALHPLSRVAEETGAAIVLVRHMNKGSGRAMYRGGGSIGITGAARSVLVVAEDPDDKTKRVLSSVKCNLAVKPPSLSYQLEACAGASRVVWLGESVHDADRLVSAPLDHDERTQLDEVVAFLLELIDEGGGEVQASDAMKRVRVALGASERTVQRARSRAGIKAVRRTFSGSYVWTRGGTVAATPARARSPDGEHDDPGEQGFPSGENTPSPSSPLASMDGEHAAPGEHGDPHARQVPTEQMASMRDEVKTDDSVHARQGDRQHARAHAHVAAIVPGRKRRATRDDALGVLRAEYERARAAAREPLGVRPAELAAELGVTKALAVAWIEAFYSARPPLAFASKTGAVWRDPSAPSPAALVRPTLPGVPSDAEIERRRAEARAKLEEGGKQ